MYLNGQNYSHNVEYKQVHDNHLNHPLTILNLWNCACYKNILVSLPLLERVKSVLPLAIGNLCCKYSWPSKQFWQSCNFYFILFYFLYFIIFLQFSFSPNNLNMKMFTFVVGSLYIFYTWWILWSCAFYNLLWQKMVWPTK